MLKTTSYKKPNRCSIFTVILDENGQIPLDQQVRINTLKQTLRGTGQSLRLRGRKPNTQYYLNDSPGSRGFAGPQDLPIKYAQEIDVYVRVSNYSTYMDNVRAGTSFFQLVNAG
jgi:hypothetical protein